MNQPMSTKERMRRMFEHREADRVPITDIPWTGTIRRWEREGMPKGMDWREYFGADFCEMLGVDITPRLPVRILEETDRYVISTSAWGVTTKNFKEEDSTPEFLDYDVHTPERWEEVKKRMTVSRDRVDWKFLEQNMPKWHGGSLD